MTDKFIKNPKDAWPIIITYLNDDGQAYQITDVDVTASDSSGADALTVITDPAKLTYSGNQASVWVQDGVDGQRYTIEVTATMTTGEKLTKRLIMNVADQ